MPFDFRTIADAQRKALALVENPERQRILEQFVDNSGPLVEASVRDALQVLVEEVNTQLAPASRLRLVQEGTRVVPEIVTLGEETGQERIFITDSDSISKVLLRMPSEVKTKAAEAAQKAGTSLNKWTVNVLERALVSLRERQEQSGESQNRVDDSGSGSSTSAPEDETRVRNP